MMKQLPTTKGGRNGASRFLALFTAAIVLAVLNALTLAVRGNPWGITSAFALWGGKADDGSWDRCIELGIFPRCKWRSANAQVC